MLRAITLLILLGPFLVAPLANAKVTAGAKGGFTFSRFGGDYRIVQVSYDGFSDFPTSDQSRTGLALGVSGTITFNRTMFLELDLLRSVKGATGSTDTKWTLTYVEIPVLIGMELKLRDGLSTFVLAGPQLGINSNSRLDVPNGADGVNHFDIANAKSSVWSAVIGVGLRVNQKRLSFTTELRYVPALTDTFDYGTVNEQSLGTLEVVSPKVKTNGFLVLLGVSAIF